MRIEVRWINRGPWLASMKALGGPATFDALEEAVGRAAIRAQDAMRQNLESMVYAQPPAPGGYIRTRTLLRSTHAASSDTDHGADEGRAHAGEDLAATSPAGLATRRGDEVSAEAGSWISYSEFVHDGVNQPTRPFVTAAVPTAQQALQEEVERAIQRRMAA